MNPILAYLCYFASLVIIFFLVVWYYLDCYSWNSGTCRIHSKSWNCYGYDAWGATRSYHCGPPAVRCCFIDIFWLSVDKPSRPKSTTTWEPENL